MSSTDTDMTRVFRFAAELANNTAALPHDVATGGLFDAAMVVAAGALRNAIGRDEPSGNVADAPSVWAADLFRAALDGSEVTAYDARCIWLAVDDQMSDGRSWMHA